jgi:hypothetical protein
MCYDVTWFRSIVTAWLTIWCTLPSPTAGGDADDLVNVRVSEISLGEKGLRFSCGGLQSDGVYQVPRSTSEMLRDMHQNGWIAGKWI